jgi:hypothetical protein
MRMTSRERLLAAIGGGRPDRIPLVCRVFGFRAPPELAWQQEGRAVPFWYTMRMEHLHTLPEPWDVGQDFKRVEAWLSLGIDDVLEISPPWGLDPQVTVRDYAEASAVGGDCPLSCREYSTPAGVLAHKVRQTGEAVPPGWVVQPEFPPLIEDFNIPRSVRPPVMGADDLAKVRYLLCPPTSDQIAAYRERMKRVRRFADEKGVLVCGWSRFGMDAVVWLCGAEGAVMMAMLQSEVFAELIDLVDAFDRMRTELMLDVGGVDLVVQRGWYSSVDFWSPNLFERFVLPNLTRGVEQVHQAGATFGYVMTTGVRPLLRYLAKAGIDLYYWADPVQGDADLATTRQELGDKVTIAGGVNAPLTLGQGSPDAIRSAVRSAIETLGPAGFILEPVDSLFPDTPWPAVKTMIDAWREMTH